jgi:molybdenum cofactor cytidylyltransferase
VGSYVIVIQILMGDIWSIILAAGESKRMGVPKMLLNIHGRTMLENVMEFVTGATAENTLVVLGADKEKLINIIRKSLVKYCYNDNYKEGMLSSVKCGCNNLPSDFDAVLVFQGDQPFISAGTINMVIDGYRSSGKGIVIPVFEKKRGHPLLIDRKFRERIEKLDNREGLRSLSYQYPEDVMEVETNDPGILKDFNTLEEYSKEFNQTY